MSDEELYAHTLCGQGPESWQPLTEHLEDVARLASFLPRSLVVGLGAM